MPFEEMSPCTPEGMAWMKIAPEYGSVITNNATFVDLSVESQIVASPKSTWASPGGFDSGRKDFSGATASRPGPRL